MKQTIFVVDINGMRQLIALHPKLLDMYIEATGLCLDPTQRDALDGQRMRADRLLCQRTTEDEIGPMARRILVDVSRETVEEASDE